MQGSYNTLAYIIPQQPFKMDIYILFCHLTGDQGESEKDLKSADHPAFT